MTMHDHGNFAIGAPGAPAQANTATCEWPRQFAPWAEESPDARSLCRSQRKFQWRLRPPSLDDLRVVLVEAAKHGTPLYPISRGCNWGYGSHLPARDGGVVVDLSRFNQIGDLDRSSLSVRIEPGVTQSELAAFLAAKAPDLVCNVTGAGCGTSVLGNAIDRGIGYLGEKNKDVFALEVLLADGSLLAPTAERNHPSRSQPSGLDTDALFFQTNFGVVVAGRIRFRRRQEAEDAILLEGPFEAVVATLKAGYDHQLFTHPTHLASPGRSHRLGFGLLRNLWGRDPTALEVERCFPEKNSFTALVPMHGRRRVVRAAWAELRRLAARGVRLHRVNARRISLATALCRYLGMKYLAARIAAIRPIAAMTWGEPSDAGLTSLDGMTDDDPDHADDGAIYGNAVSSCDAASAEAVAAIVRRGWSDAAFTWQVLSQSCIITIYTLHFRGDEATAAHAANQEIVTALRSAGFPPYRLDINTTAPRGAEAITARLKEALDRKRTLAPGRYE